MAITEVWLEVKNGRTIVLDTETARKQHKRWHKRRKGGPSSKHHVSAKKRKRGPAATATLAGSSAQGNNDEEDAVRHENVQLFADAQAQLQQEMVAAGFGDDALPLSFGSTHASASSSSSRKRKRKRHDHIDYHDQEDASVPEPLGNNAEVVVSTPATFEKVHVTFDSDGEIAERVVEAIVLPEQVTTQDSEATRSEEGADAQPVTRTVEGPEPTIDGSEEPVPVDPAVFKFWKQRRTLFHKYDEGIQLDHESWYSVTPESIAQHIATRCACDVIVDPFSGCGGNIIQFAKTCKQVIAIEIDAEKIRMAKANAAIYGVADRIEWIHGDALEVLPTLQADVVFLSPPWGGMDYNRSRFGIADMMISNTSGVELFEMARRVAKNVVYYLPKTTPEDELVALAPVETVECEHIHLNGQLKVVNAYFGDLAVPTYNHQVEELPAEGVDRETQQTVDAADLVPVTE